MLSKTLVITSLKSSGLWLVTIILVSSAKMTGLELSFMVTGKSFTKAEKAMVQVSNRVVLQY
jgi:hypothetical protein